MSFFPFRRRIRHPFFPDLAGVPAADAHGRAKALAGTFVELAQAAARGVEARRAVFVLTGQGRHLSGDERDELWRLFQVPVYALLMERSGEMAAWECEAQNGHVEGGSKCVCACGRPGVQLTNGLRPGA